MDVYSWTIEPIKNIYKCIIAVILRLEIRFTVSMDCKKFSAPNLLIL
jgi:hypothetical protein